MNSLSVLSLKLTNLCAVCFLVSVRSLLHNFCLAVMLFVVLLHFNNSSISDNCADFIMIDLKYGHLDVTELIHLYWHRSGMECLRSLDVLKKLRASRYPCKPLSHDYIDSVLISPSTQFRLQSLESMTEDKSHSNFDNYAQLLQYNDIKATNDSVYNMLGNMCFKATLSLKLVLEKMMTAISRGQVPIRIETTKFIPQGDFEDKNHCDGSITQRQRELESIHRASHGISEPPVLVDVGSGTTFDGDRGVIDVAQKLGHRHEETSIQVQKNEVTNVTYFIKLGCTLPIEDVSHIPNSLSVKQQMTSNDI